MVLAVFLGCSSGHSGDRALRISVATEPSTLDPARADDATATYLLPNLWEGLTRFDAPREVESGIAEMWSFSTDLRTVTFTLRDDAFWSDGAPVVAADFVFAWRRLLDPATESEHASLLFDIVNAEEVNSGDLPPLSLGVEAPNPRTLVVRFDAPALDFPRVSALPPTVPLREDVVRRYGARWSEPQNLVVNGAYRIARYQSDYCVTLEANPDYFRGPPDMVTVQLFVIPNGGTALALFERGDLDMVFGLSPVAVSHYSGERTYRNPDAPDEEIAVGVARPQALLPRALARSHLVNPNLVGPTLLTEGGLFLEKLLWAE